MPSESTAPARRRDAEANRESLIDSAQRLIAEDPAASIDAIARAAGLSRRAVYGHFADRGKLVDAVLARCAERISGIAARNRADCPAHDALPALADIAAALWREADAVRAVAALARDGEHGEAAALALAPLRARLFEVCEAGRARGSVRGDLTAEQTARLLEEVARAAILDAGAATAQAQTEAALAERFDIASRAVLGAAGCGWREADELLRGDTEVVPDPGPDPTAEQDRVPGQDPEPDPDPEPRS